MPTIKVEYSLDVQANAERLWDILTDFKSWPEWKWTSYINPIPNSPVKDGSKFVAELGGHKWNMTIVKADRPYKLSWLARQSVLSTLHEWEFIKNGEKTRVVSRERMSGWLLLFLNSVIKKNLQKTDEKWLSELKIRAEKS